MLNYIKNLILLKYYYLRNLVSALDLCLFILQEGAGAVVENKALLG